MFPPSKRRPRRPRRYVSMLIISRELRKKPALRNIYVTLTACLWLVLAVLLFDNRLRYPLNSGLISKVSLDAFLVVLLFFVGYGLVAGLLAFIDEHSATGLLIDGKYVRSDIVSIRKERVQLEERLRKSDSPREE